MDEKNNDKNDKYILDIYFTLSGIATRLSLIAFLLFLILISIWILSF